ncbi:hypothetical protein FJY70_05915, partial [candidate division WOR-3 bacterium]|nr:hypothetical protein [candidate division WOR-3 bacterium]
MNRAAVFVLLILAGTAPASGLTGAAGVQVPGTVPLTPDLTTPAPTKDGPFRIRVGIEIAIGSNGRTPTGNPYTNACYQLDTLCQRQGWSSKLVTFDSINTTQKLSNYDVIVTGDCGYNDNDFLSFQDTLKKWVRNGGGFVTLGWAVYGIAGKSAHHMDSVCAVKAITGGYGFLTSGTVQITNNTHPITQGVSNFNVSGYGEYAYNDTWPGAVRLGNYSAAPGYSSIAYRTPGSGRSVYLGPVYFGTFAGYPGSRQYYADTATNAKRLIKQAIEWAGFGDALPGDVGTLRIIGPSGNIPYGVPVIPQAKVKNYSTVTQSFPVRFNIGTFYSRTRYVTNLAAGDSATVSFDTWPANVAGSHALKCSTQLYSDTVRSNDKATGACFVPLVDAGVRAILAPTGTIPYGTP